MEEYKNTDLEKEKHYQVVVPIWVWRKMVAVRGAFGITMKELIKRAIKEYLEHHSAEANQLLHENSKKW